MNKIPVISTGIVNNVALLERLINSIDYPTENFVIFNNNGRDEITDHLESLKKINHPFIDKITICHLPHNIGCAGWWNLTIKSYITSPYWILANNDFAFHPGGLAKMVEDALPENIGMVHCSGDDYIKCHSYVCFLIKDWVVQKIGLFDENLYPGYGEDVDYFFRILLDPFDRTYLKDVPYYHGNELDNGNGDSYKESGSQTWRTDTSLKEKIDSARYINENEYITRKWGQGWRYCDIYKTPFDGKENLKYDLSFNRRKHLGF